MNITDRIRATLANEWIPDIYTNKIRSQRTRAYRLDIASRENTAEILYTLLGIELKVGRKRFACPDLATARYLRVFVRIGCTGIAIPYDITKISAIADELETAWQKMLLIFDRESGDRPAAARARLRSNLMKALREEILEIGPGEAMPEFKKSTKQRKNS